MLFKGMNERVVSKDALGQDIRVGDIVFYSYMVNSRYHYKEFFLVESATKRGSIRGYQFYKNYDNEEYKLGKSHRMMLDLDAIILVDRELALKKFNFTEDDIKKGIDAINEYNEKNK